MDILLVLGGFVALLLGGDALVRGAVGLAARMGLSPLVIGITLVGFGTSTPELLTSVQAALAGSPGIALGNVVGSNTANILLILGLSALIAPIAVARSAVLRDGVMVVVVAFLAAGIALTGEIGRIAGLGLLAVLAGYLVWAMRSDDPVAFDEVRPADRPWLAALQFAGGLAVTLVGAKLLVTGAIGIAQGFGVSETVIGVTVVAVGTSLPELVTSVIAARQGRSDLALGNVLGSNIFNLSGILGITALVQPLAVPPEVLALDLWVMLGATLVLIAAILSGWRVTRAEGAGMLALYAAYAGWLVVVST